MAIWPTGMLVTERADGRLHFTAEANINDIKDQDADKSEKLSEKSAVLLKNDGDSLPLNSSVLSSSVAVIGPTARQVMVYSGGGERARGFPDRDEFNPAANA
jgi:beta-glucosidase-like glycosyl hydrolase